MAAAQLNNTAFRITLFTFALLAIFYIRLYRHSFLPSVESNVVTTNCSILPTLTGNNRPTMLYSSSRSVRERVCASKNHTLLILLLAGDIESNPGPRTPKYPCKVCSKAVKNNDMAVCCDSCDQWLHNRCSGVSDHMYAILQGSDCQWICPSCGIPNFSASFFNIQDSITTENHYSSLSDESSFHLSPQSAHKVCHSTPLVSKKAKENNYKPNKLAKKYKNNVKPLKIISLNANGIRGKVLELQLLINKEHPDIICCQETRIDSGISSSELFPPNFIVYRKDRNCHGGGVCIAVSDKLTASPCPDLDSETESIWIKLTSRGSSCSLKYVCCIYRPPGSSINYLETFGSATNKLLCKYKNKTLPHITIVGDFNYPGVDWINSSIGTSHGGKAILDFAFDNFLTQMVLEPTRLGVGSCNILDLLFTTHCALIDNLHIGPLFSDHCIIAFHVNNFVPNKHKPPRKIYLYGKTNLPGLKNDLATQCNDFLNIAPNLSLEKNWCQFKIMIENVVQKHVPTKQISICDSRPPPWLSHKIRHLIKSRDRLSRRALKSGSYTDRDLFRQSRTKVKKAITTEYNAYVLSIIGDIHSAPRKFYKFINSKRTDNHSIPSLQHNNTIVDKDIDKATLLNNHFAASFTSERTEYIPFIWSHNPCIQPIVVSTLGVTKLLENLNANKALGPDEISPFILKTGAKEIGPVLSFIFNQSLISGEIPKDWLDANVVPLHKKGRRDMADNYRPVSLTCIASKIIEHIIYSSVANHLESNKILTPSQHGFRPGHSCETQLISAVNDWSKTINDGDRVDIAILDFSKAFDSVPHERLKSKLHQYGIRGNTLMWISAFLGFRRQRVLLNGATSDWCDVRSGVPQGTVLGPLLFLLYINDIGNDITSTIRLFADDCVLYRTIKSDQDSAILQTDLKRLVEWSDEWQMSFNIKKCYMMHMTQQRKSKSLYSYSMKGIPLTSVTSHPYLGIEIQSSLRWDDHIDKITSKASKTLGMIRRNLSGCTKEIKLHAYKSLVRPQLEYASSVWDPHTAKHTHKLEMVQRRAARFVSADYRYKSSPSAMIHSLKLQSLEARRKSARLSILYKAINGKIALPLTDLRKPVRSTRNSSLKSFTQLGARCDSYKFSFFPRTIVDWNSLPQEIVDSLSVDSFRSALASHFV